MDRIRTRVVSLCRRLSRKAPTTVETTILVVAGLFVAFSWYALLLVELGMFGKLSILLGLVLILLTGALVTKGKAGVIAPTRVDWIAIAFTAVYTAFHVAFFHDTFYGGRDPGVLSNAAAYLANHHTVLVARFINHPGWVWNGEFYMVQFPLAPISWLASFHLFGGYDGIRYANALPLAITLMSLYLLTKRIWDGRTGLAAILLLATAYPMFWFTRGTFNEVFFMAPVWAGLLGLVVWWRERYVGALALAIAAFGLNLHTRLEGVPIFIVAIVLVIWMLRSRGINNRSIWGLGGLISVVMVHFALYLIFVQRFYFVGHFENLVTFFQSDQGLGIAPPGTNLSAVRYHLGDFVLTTLSAYHLLWPLLFIPIAVLIGIVSPKRGSLKGWLLVLVVISPTFIFLRFPFVSLDQPWFLKRYVAIILPAAFISATVSLVRISRNWRTVSGLVSLAIILNLVVASPILFHREYAGMIEKTEELSRLFSENDTVLVDRHAAGVYKLADPLFYQFDRYALWVSSSTEISEFVNKTVAEGEAADGGLFLITSVESPLYSDLVSFPSLELLHERPVSYRELEPTADIFRYPDRPPDAYDLDYTIVESLIGVPRLIREMSFTLQIYRIHLDIQAAHPES